MKTLLLCLALADVAFGQTGNLPAPSVGSFVAGYQALFLPYKQGTTSATTLTDYSSNSYNGTFGSGAYLPTWKADGSGIVFNANTYISVPSGVLNGTGTIQMWFALTSPQSEDLYGSGGPEVLLADSANNLIGTQGAYNGQLYTASGASQPNARGTDRYVGPSGAAWTYSGSTILQYINGRPVSGYLPAVSGAGTINWNGSGVGYIGNLPASPGYGSSFVLYGLVVYPTVLTPAQIAQNDFAFKAQMTAATGVQFSSSMAPYVYIAQGDSRIIDYNQYTLEYSMPYLVFGKTNNSVYINIGVGSQTEATAYTNISSREYPLLDGTNSAQNFVWNQSGTNDIVAGTSAATVVTSLQNYCSALHTRYPGLKILVNTPPPRSDSSSTNETHRQTLVSTLVSDWVGGTLGCDGLADEGEDMLAVNSTSPNPYVTSSAYNATYYRDGIHYMPVLAQELASQDACSVLDVLGRMFTPCWISKTIPYTALTEYGAVASKVATILQLGPNWQVCGVKAQVQTAFAGTNISALALTIGDSTGTAAQYLSSLSLLATGSNMAQAPNYVSNHGLVQGTFTATGANLNSLTAGSMNLDVCVVNQP